MSQSKYDRQLRLWGEIAQQRLEKTRLLSIGSDSTATEYLKSSILPGIGYVCIVDDKIIDEEDLETNFFVGINDLGKERGEVTKENLMELNDLVKGEYKKKSLDEILQDESFVKSFDLIVCSNKPHEFVVQLSKMTTKPILEVHTNGYYGLVKAYYESQVIFDNGKPEMKMDLRIPNPVPKFKEMYESLHFETLSKDQKKHVPFPIILLWALGEWRKQNNTDGIPKGRQQQMELKEIIKKGHNLYLEENYGEAHSFAYYCWPSQEESLIQLMKDERTEKCLKGMTIEQIEFLTFISSVKKFVEKNGRTPQDSTLKDMICGNEYFTQMQSVFTAQMTEDAQELLLFIEEKLKNDETNDIVTFDLEKTKRMCKTMRKMTVFDGVNGEINNTWENNSWMLFEIEEGQLNPEGALLLDLAVFTAILDFQKEYGRIPCGENDVDILLSLTKNVLKRKNIDYSIDIERVSEFCRFGGIQIHAVNAVIGSFVSQEIVKFSIHQFSPLKNTFFFDTQSGRSLHGFF